jgi:ATP-binding cassette subfamily A (ABC1) protein 3
VVREAQFVTTREAETPDVAVKVQNLTKVYGNGYPAVNGTSFHIKKNEVLGLLGPNGAGKSTTFSILTMDQPKSFGEIRVLRTHIEDFDCMTQGKFLGLAAQANIIWDTLTVDEHLTFIGKVKGLSP